LGSRVDAPDGGILARDEILGRTFVTKLLWFDLELGDTVVMQFRQNLFHMAHPNICQVFDIIS
jgi:hypothetical protein